MSVVEIHHFYLWKKHSKTTSMLLFMTLQIGWPPNHRRVTAWLAAADFPRHGPILAKQHPPEAVGGNFSGIPKDQGYMHLWETGLNVNNNISLSSKWDHRWPMMTHLKKTYYSQGEICTSHLGCSSKHTRAYIETPSWWSTPTSLLTLCDFAILQISSTLA